MSVETIFPVYKPLKKLLAGPDMPGMPPPPSPPPTEVDVDPTKEETRKRLRKSAAANTLMTGEMLEAPTVMKPRL